MANEWDAGMCNEKSGFLFSHECFNVPTSNCDRCQKPICYEHAHEDGKVMICTTCAKKRQSRDRGRSGGRGGRSHFDHHDPYFYSGYYYGHGYHGGLHGHGHDPFDFTEADGANLMGDSHDGFEDDMSAS